MLTESHIVELKTAANLLRADWDDLTWPHSEESRKVMAHRLEAVVEQASKWKPPGEPTPIKDVSYGWYFIIFPGGTEHYVRVGRCHPDGRYCIYSPDDSKHGKDIEDLILGILFYPAPSPQKLMAMCSEKKE